MDDMPRGWRRATVGEVIELQRGHDITRAEQRPGSVPVISSGGITSYHDSAAVDGPGVVVGRKGTLGTVFFVDKPYWPHDTTLWVRDFKGNDPRYIYYWVKDLHFERFNVGSANPTLNRNHVHPLPCLVPPLAEQRAIAGVLGALDDKIESNRRIKHQLKAISELRLRALVGTPVGGSPSASDNCRQVHIGSSDVRVVSPGLSVPGSDHPLEYLATAAVFDNEYESGEVGLRVDLPSRANMEPRDDRVWFARMKSTAKCLWTPSEFNSKWSRFVLSTGFLGLESSDPRLAPLLMTSIRCSEFEEVKDQLCNGTTMQSLNNDSARNIWFQIPIEESALTDISSAIRENLLLEQRLGEESIALKSIRDALLPELLSGRLRVKDAEKVVEGAL